MGEGVGGGGGAELFADGGFADVDGVGGLLGEDADFFGCEAGFH